MKFPFNFLVAKRPAQATLAGLNRYTRIIGLLGLLALAGLLQACQAFADLHNTTTAAQRSKAVATLNGYEQDFRALSAQSSWALQA